ncbi:MAG: 50S ribosomal protein L13 [Planctomycetaceae bacterium]|nr:50S ribosomal protein L13 [Planctomycetaceae bacterium]
MNCYQAKAGELAKQWYVIDASGQVVGRLAAQIAPILMGKHRPTYTPHIDTGDYVIVTNVDKVVFTGNKWQEKSYQRYSGYPGGQREEAAWKLFQRHPERILQLAIQRMMPKNKLGRHMMAKLKLYVGADHPHQAQRPVPLEPLSGRPASAGALSAPPTIPPVARKVAKMLAELDALNQEKAQELTATEQEFEQAVVEAEPGQAATAAEQEPAAPPAEPQAAAATIAAEPAATPVEHQIATAAAAQKPTMAAEDELTAAAATSISTPEAVDLPRDETAFAGGEKDSPPEPEAKAPASPAAPPAEPASPE